MDTKNKVTIGARIEQKTKDKLETEAQEKGISVSAHLAYILDNYCNSITIQNNNNQELLQRIKKLDEYSKFLESELEDGEENFNFIEAENLKLKEQLKGGTLALNQEGFEPKIIEQVPASLELSNKERFEKQLNYFVKDYPNYTKSQLIEFAVGTAYQNDHNFFFVHTIGQFIDKYPNYTKLKKSE